MRATASAWWLENSCGTISLEKVCVLGVIQWNIVVDIFRKLCENQLVLSGMLGLYSMSFGLSTSDQKVTVGR